MMLRNLSSNSFLILLRMNLLSKLVLKLSRLLVHNQIILTLSRVLLALLAAKDATRKEYAHKDVQMFITLKRLKMLCNAYHVTMITVSLLLFQKHTILILAQNGILTSLHLNLSQPSNGLNIQKLVFSLILVLILRNGNSTSLNYYQKVNGLLILVLVLDSVLTHILRNHLRKKKKSILMMLIKKILINKRKKL